MDTNKMRAEFETQFVEEYVRVLGEGARELAAHALAANSPVVSMSWWAWQASRAAVVVDITWATCLVPGGNPLEVIDACRAKVEAQGLKVTQ